MNETKLQIVYNNSIYTRGSKKYSSKKFVNVHNGCIGTHWTCFYEKDNKSFYFDSFGGSPNKILLNQLPERKRYHNYKIQDIHSRLCRVY